jgi:putative oxidoreductase
MTLRNLIGGTTIVDKKSVNFALLFLRFYAGITIMSAGLDKLPLKDWMVEQVVSLGFPFPVLFAWIATFSEFAFGFLLIFGAITRLSGFMLAITIGVAAFGFHKVLPFIDMHITQYFFWIFVFFTIFGAGKYSLDYFLQTSKIKNINILPTALFSLLIVYALFIEFNADPPKVESELEVVSISVAGSFNEWNPSSNEMEKVNENKYITELNIIQAGLVEFKFTINNSWDINLGEENQSPEGFPISGTAELDKGNNTNNIKVYIPNPGIYRIELNEETYDYSVDSVSADK